MGHQDGPEGDTSQKAHPGHCWSLWEEMSSNMSACWSQHGEINTARIPGPYRDNMSHRVYFSKGLCVIDETFQVVVIYRFIVLQLYSGDRC